MILTDEPRLEDFAIDQGVLYGKLTDSSLKRQYEELVLALLDQVLPFMPMFIPYFTDHGANHSREVVRIMNDLSHKANPSLNKFETFALLASAWLHDVGLLRNIDPDTGLKLSYKEIREKHGELSASVIRDFSRELHLNHDDAMREAIVTICRRHQRETEIRDLACKFIVGEREIRLDLLVSLLRVADVLDVRRRRAPWLAREMLYPPLASRIHWRFYEKVHDGMPRFNLDEAYVELVSTGDDNDKAIFLYKLKDVYEEILRVKDVLAKSGVRLSEVKYVFQDEESHTRREEGFASSDLQKGLRYYFAEAVNKHFQKRYDNLSSKDKDKDGWMLLDLSIEAAEQEGEESEKREIYWRDKALAYFEKLEMSISPSGFHFVRKTHNQLRLKELRNTGLTTREKVFMRDMDKIRKSLDYFREAVTHRSMEPIMGPLLLLRFGLTPVRQDLRHSVRGVMKNRIVSKDKLAFVHNECNLCTGRILSMLAYASRCTGAAEDSFGEKEINALLGKTIEWVKTQRTYRYSTIGRNTGAVSSPRYAAAVLEGLVDTYVFQEELRDDIRPLMDEVAKTVLELSVDLDVSRIEEHLSLVLSSSARALYSYLRLFPEERTRLDGLDSLSRNMGNIESTSLINRLEGWGSLLFWDLWEDDDLRTKVREGSEKIRKDCCVSEIWREDGSWGDNLINTKQILSNWLAYWEHSWLLESRNEGSA